VLEITACQAEADELASVKVYNTVWPQDAVTIEAVHAYYDSALDHIDYLVREHGVTSGSGAGAIFAYRAHRVVTLITVLGADAASRVPSRPRRSTGRSPTATPNSTPATRSGTRPSTA
jgi:hypothetical protein